jgi:ribonuclease J
MVDGLRVGDVGSVVLADRKTMSQDGMVTIIIPKRKGEFDTKNIYIASRGFIFMKQSDEMIGEITNTTAKIVRESGDMNEQELKKKIEKQLTRRLEEVIGRKPLILPVFMEV